MSFFKIFAKIGLDASEFNAGLKQAESGVGLLGKSMAGLGAKLAGAFTLTAIAAYGAHVVKVAGDIADLAEALHLTNTEVQKLQKLSAESGVSFEKYEKAIVTIRKLKAEFQGGNKAAIEVFRKTGLDPNAREFDILRSLRGMDDSKVFLILGEKVAKLSESLHKIDEISPIELFSDSTIENADKLSDQLSKILRITDAITGRALNDLTTSTPLTQFFGKWFEGMKAKAMLNPYLPFLMFGKSVAQKADEYNTPDPSVEKFDAIPTGRTSAKEKKAISDKSKAEFGSAYDSFLLDDDYLRSNMIARKSAKFSALPTDDLARIGGGFGPNQDLASREREQLNETKAMRRSIDSIAAKVNAVDTNPEMSAFQGNPDFVANRYVLTSERAEFDPQTGTYSVQEFQGTQAGAASIGAALLAAGARVSYDIKGGVNTCTARWGRNPNDAPEDETPKDRWELSLEPYQISIFRHPAVVRDAGDEFALYRKSIQDAVDAGEANPLPSLPIASQVYRLLSQGTEYWETQRPTLRKSRTFTESYSGRSVLYSYESPPVYTRATLISEFGVPSEMQSRIPTDPTEPIPAGTVWGWRLKQQSSAYVPSIRKWEENTEWDFATWQSGLYTIL